ncbi:hypothetical protein FRB97_009010 [Tulasnella sp. 331]|nr:hypothetical protein FRB97_009010 [Tulasnella sp. 331]KAG8873665.1 hypothetical protein FRB98_008853 [Tulasnella sp. 332]
MADPEIKTGAETPSFPSPSLFSLIGKTAVVTGGTRGIGAACALALAQAGAAICLLQRDPSKTSTRDAIRTLDMRSGSPSKCEIVEVDLSDTKAARAAFQKGVEVMGGRIDILVNCAGIQRRAPAVDFSDDDWNDVLQTNLTSCWVLCQEAGKHMVPQRSGKIINFASLLTFQGGLTVPAYAAAKGGLGQLTKALSNEWAKHNVQVNAIAPGYIATEMNEKLLGDPIRYEQISVRIPAGRWGKPEDFAGPVLFLASDASMYVSGETLVVDGGWMGR